MYKNLLGLVLILTCSSNAQLAYVLESDLFEPMVYGLVDLITDPGNNQDVEAFIKTFRKTLFSLFLVNKKINRNTRRLFDKKMLDETKKIEIENLLAQKFFNYCLIKNAQKIQYSHNNIPTGKLPLAKQILFCSHYASSLSIDFLNNFWKTDKSFSLEEFKNALNATDTIKTIRDNHLNSLVEKFSIPIQVVLGNIVISKQHHYIDNKFQAFHQIKHFNP